MSQPTERQAALQDAEQQAKALFDEIAARSFIRPGRMESEVNADIHRLAAERFGVEAHWHKRIVRAGANTLCPYDDNPPDLRIKDDDLVFIDLGPVFGSWEADLGRSYVLGDDPIKHRLVEDAATCWHLAKRHVHGTPDITAAELFAHVAALARTRGWQLGQWHVGHLIGDFPHDRPPEKVHNFLMPGNDRPLRGVDRHGQPLEWILEIHFVAPGAFGSFFEQLLGA